MQHSPPEVDPLNAINIPSYLYSLFASLIIGTILVSAVSVETLAIRNNAKDQQLKNIQQYVAAQALHANLTNHTRRPNHHTAPKHSLSHRQRTLLDTPHQQHKTAHGSKSGFGLNTTSNRQTLTLPTKATAKAAYLSGSGRPTPAMPLSKTKL